MPESAEVRVAAAQLHHAASGRVVRRLTVTHPRTSRAQPAADLGGLTGRQITAVAPHGKWIVLAFDGGETRLGIHLRMSGQLLARTTGATPSDRHVHARFALGPRTTYRPDLAGVPAPPPAAPGVDDGAFEVWFRDPRTFGELRVLTAEVPVAPDLHDPAVTPGLLATAARRRTVGAKAVLLDQLRSVSGIGSYLADEALHRRGDLAPSSGREPGHDCVGTDPGRGPTDLG